ncbi:type II secretion system F family protein [Actinospongicola halichondriae]|uniref:type II secretion system F family protein n=1 Tax=Actinospongicola halichondriae TaxID=3236844 RepID=UPI003D37E4D6
MTGVSWLAVFMVGGGFALLSVGVLSRVYEREEELAKILDLPWGEQDVDIADVAERHSQLVENTIGVAGKVIDSIDAKGSLLTKLEKARVPIRPGEFVVLVGAVGVIGGAVVAAATSSIGFGFVALLVTPFVGAAYLNRRISQRRKKFEETFPEALTLIASSLSAGHTFLRAIQMMNEEAEGPLAEEFGRVVAETQLGDPLVDALERLSERVDVRDVDWVVQAIKIQQEVGGKLADLLHTLADFIRAREEVRREIDVLTAEGRVSAFVLGGLPAFLLIAIQVMNPGYMEPMFRGWGWIWLGGAAVICTASIGIILRMVNSVEV